MRTEDDRKPLMEYIARDVHLEGYECWKLEREDFPSLNMPREDDDEIECSGNSYIRPLSTILS